MYILHVVCAKNTSKRHIYIHILLWYDVIKYAVIEHFYSRNFSKLPGLELSNPAAGFIFIKLTGGALIKSVG